MPTSPVLTPVIICVPPTGGDLVHATLLLGFEEFFFQPLRDAARNAEELRRVIKRRQGLMLDYEHHKVGRRLLRGAWEGGRGSGVDRLLLRSVADREKPAISALRTTSLQQSSRR